MSTPSTAPSPVLLQPCPDCAHPCSPAATFCPNCGRPFKPREPAPSEKLNDTIFSHIMNQSSMKIGMCLTLLGLIKVVEGVQSMKVVVDELLAMDAVAFLLSTILTYFALKSRTPKGKRLLGRAADIIFSIALVILAGVCLVLAIGVI